LGKAGSVRLLSRKTTLQDENWQLGKFSAVFFALINVLKLHLAHEKDTLLI
jgi:hypothetical protein